MSFATRRPRWHYSEARGNLKIHGYEEEAIVSEADSHCSLYEVGGVPGEYIFNFQVPRSVLDVEKMSSRIFMVIG